MEIQLRADQVLTDEDLEKLALIACEKRPPEKWEQQLADLAGVSVLGLRFSVIRTLIELREAKPIFWGPQRPANPLMLAAKRTLRPPKGKRWRWELDHDS